MSPDLGLCVPGVLDLEERPATESSMVVHCRHPERSSSVDLCLLGSIPLAGHLDDEVQEILLAVPVLDPRDEVG